MTIAAPDWTFDAQVEQDEIGMLWLNPPNINRPAHGALSAVGGAQDRVAHRERVTRRAGDAGGARVW